MSGYGQFCPVAKAAEIVAERWTPLILRELLCGSHRFGDLADGVPRMSPSMLSARLKHLQRAGLVERRTDADGPTWHLTVAGEELRPVIESLGAWGQRWMHEIVETELDPTLLMVDLRRHIRLDRVPPDGVVLQLTFTDADPGERNWWVLLRPPEVDVCQTDRGFAVDLWVTTTVLALTRVWMGEVGLHDAIRAGTIALSGAAPLQRDLHSWLELSVFADVPRAPHPLPRVDAAL